MKFTYADMSLHACHLAAAMAAFLVIYAAYVAFMVCIAQMYVPAGGKGSPPSYRSVLSALPCVWIITTVNALLTSAVGCVAFYQLHVFSYDMPRTADWLVTSGVSYACCVVFCAYLVVDGVMCVLAYGANANIGVAHHSMYFALVLYLVCTKKEAFFCFAMIEELPSLVVGLVICTTGSKKSILLTGAMVRSLRLALHVYIAMQTVLCTGDAHDAAFYLAAWVMHLQWYGSWMHSYVGGVAKVIGTQADASMPSVASAIANIGMCELLFTGVHAGSILWRFAKKGSWSGAMAAEAAGCVLTTAYALKCLYSVHKKHYLNAALASGDTIVYNISWEDPREEREALDIGRGDVILTIASAGCNVLDYLIEGPDAIVACDMNPAQLAVLRLKMLCIQHLEHGQFFSLWAESDVTTFEAVYTSKLRGYMSGDDKTFWDKHGVSLFGNNFFYAGTSGTQAYWLRFILPLFFPLWWMQKTVTKVPLLGGYVVAVARQVMMPALKATCCVFAPLGGVPPRQLALTVDHFSAFTDAFIDMLGRRMWLDDNYFYHAYMKGRWTTACCPRYLKREHFADLKRYIGEGRVHVFHGTVAEAAATRDDFTVASLLDSMDWMDDDMIAGQLSVLIPRMKPGKRQGAAVFWRGVSPFVHSPVLGSLMPEQLHEIDGRERVGWYLSQWIALVEPGVALGWDVSASSLGPAIGTGRVLRNTLMQDAHVGFEMAKQACASTKSSPEFYANQSDVYDGFREELLPGRQRQLQHGIPWRHLEPGSTWLSVGCGTARDLEYVVEAVKLLCVHVYLLDLSPALLAVAEKRVEELGVAENVTFICGDVNRVLGHAGPAACDQDKATPCDQTVDDQQKSHMPMQFDVVTCTYCLTMIPDWQAALECMRAAVKPGGYLSLLDFTVRSGHAGSFVQRFTRWWFSNDGVYLNHEQPAQLRVSSEFAEVWYDEGTSRVPYTILYPTHYTYTGRKKNQAPTAVTTEK